MLSCVLELYVMINELADARLLFGIIRLYISAEKLFNRINNGKATTGHKLTRTKRKSIKSSSAGGGN